MVNTSPRPLTILNARATCGCTSPKFASEPVAPGDTALLTVSYDPAGRPGRFDKKIYVDTDGQPRRSTLHIVGSVIATPATVARKYPVEAGPLRLKQTMLPFGEMHRQEVKSTYIEAYNVTTDTVGPKLEGLPDYIHVMVSPKRIPPGEQAVISATFYGRESPLWGYVEGDAILRPDDGSDWPTVTLPWMATVSEDFSTLTDSQRADAPVAVIAPEVVDLTPLASAATGVREVRLTIANDGKNPLHIRRIYTHVPGVTIPAKLPAKVKHGKSVEIPLGIDPSNPPEGLINDTLIIITNDPSRPVTKLRLVGDFTNKPTANTHE